MEKTSEYIKARDRAIKYIMFKMRTSYEVFNKLLELEFDEEVINKVIDDLKELEYINDEEYTRRFIETNKKSKKVSKSFIKIKLKNKGIDNEIIEKYVDELNLDDTDAIKKQLIKKKFTSNMPYEEKNKIIAFCVRKGFRQGDIIRVMKSIEGENNYEL